MAGLVNEQMGGNPSTDVVDPGKLQSAQAVGYDSAQRAVTPDQTVAGQVDKITGADSPLMQRAKASAADYSNSRGLLNSTMGAQAGEAAVIDAAMPMATQDAATFGTASRDNQAATNTSLQAGADAATRTNLANAGDANQITKIREQGAQDIGVQTLRGTQATTLADIEANYKTLIQSSDAAAKMYQMTQQTVGQLMGDVNTSPEQKQAAVAKESALLQTGLTIIGSIGNLDLTGLLDFTV